MWTQTTPTEDGYYWLKMGPGWKATIAQVYRGKYLLFSREDDSFGLRDFMPGAYWCGPLTLPKHS